MIHLQNTGKRKTTQVVRFWTLKDGKIARFQQYADTDQVNCAIARYGLLFVGGGVGFMYESAGTLQLSNF